MNVIYSPEIPTQAVEIKEERVAIFFSLSLFIHLILFYANHTQCAAAAVTDSASCCTIILFFPVCLFFHFKRCTNKSFILIDLFFPRSGVIIIA